MSVALNFNDGFDIGPQFYKFLFTGAFRMANGQRGEKSVQTHMNDYKIERIRKVDATDTITVYDEF